MRPPMDVRRFEVVTAGLAELVLCWNPVANNACEPARRERLPVRPLQPAKYLHCHFGGCLGYFGCELPIKCSSQSRDYLLTTRDRLYLHRRALIGFRRHSGNDYTEDTQRISPSRTSSQSKESGVASPATAMCASINFSQ